MGTQRIQSALDSLENETRLVKFIALALCERAPKEEREAVLRRFQGLSDEMVKNAPAGIDSEILVDLAARAEIHAAELRELWGSK